MNTHHLTLVVFTCYHLQRLHDNEASYDRIGGGNGGNDVASHGYRRKEGREGANYCKFWHFLPLTLDVESALHGNPVVKGSQVCSCHDKIQRDLIILKCIKYYHVM